MAIPPNMLTVDPDIAPQSPKGYNWQELEAIAETVPKVYQRLAQGYSPDALLAARSSPDAQERAIGTTYAHLFDATNSSEVLSADLTESGLLVTKGNHRIAAAQRAGIDYLPVEVRAPDQARLDDLAAGLAATHGARYQRLAELHRQQDVIRGLGRDPRPERGPERTAR